MQPLIYLIFIGGAADKEPFLWGNKNLPFTYSWTHYTVRSLAEDFHEKLSKTCISQKWDLNVIEQQCRFDYLSYTEVFLDELKESIPLDEENVPPFIISNEKFERLKKQIGEHTHIYIIGHSLGGWNGAHLSYLFALQGIKTDYLITLDPVGTGNHEISLINPLMKKAQIYSNEPKPIAENWFNIQARHLDVAKKQVAGTFEDWVAWAGGQWLIDHDYQTVGKQTSETTNFSHKDAQSLFDYPTKLGYSASDALLNAVLKAVKQARRKRFNPLNWFD